jgi:hypothetical protein
MSTMAKKIMVDANGQLGWHARYLLSVNILVYLVIVQSILFVPFM